MPTASAGVVAVADHTPAPISTSMPRLRSIPHNRTSPAADAGARPAVTPHSGDPFPAPEDPTTRVCSPATRSTHGVPSSHRPIGTAAVNTSRGTVVATRGACSTECMTSW